MFGCSSRLLLPAQRTTALALVLSLGALGAACDKKSPSAAPLADITAGEHGFTPSSLKLPSGGPGSHSTVSFVRVTDETCATEVVFPELGVKKELPLNQPVKVDVPTDTAKTLAFQCGMGMYKGALVVSDKK